MKISKLGALGAPALLSFEATGSMLEVPTQCSGFLFSDGLFPSGFGPFLAHAPLLAENHTSKRTRAETTKCFRWVLFQRLSYSCGHSVLIIFRSLFDRRPRPSATPPLPRSFACSFRSDGARLTARVERLKVFVHESYRLVYNKILISSVAYRTLAPLYGVTNTLDLST